VQLSLPMSLAFHPFRFSCCLDHSKKVFNLTE